MTTALSFIFVLGILVFVHEFGHFLVARLCGIRVEKFSLGFPPKLISKKVGHTEYMISWIPLGGFVKLAGENPEESTGANPWEFLAQPVWKRSLVIVAGPVMNILLAILFFWGLLFFQGLEIANYESTVIGQLSPSGPAEKAGLKPGDKILSVNGTPVTDFKQMAGIIYEQVEKPVLVVWERGGQVFQREITTFKEKEYNKKGESRYTGRIGISPETSHRSLNLFESLTGGIGVTSKLCGEIFSVLYGLITGTMSLKTLGGPIFIAQAAGQTAQQGISALLFFTALLSVNLAILNLLPIPVLDGGHLLFLAIEKIRRRPLSVKQRTVMQQVGMGFLLVLILFITYNDIFRLLGK
ncbi:MAG: RIP metalloprotease RseP [candidate division Zixibacteria bacterium RBG_16_48_11]|jgi:regulator of sigma E protease|nr:MAG: RIP metalloprotease RseP [candidate division Zixibacteria bacterium RBG_16_48_11]